MVSPAALAGLDVTALGGSREALLALGFLTRRRLRISDVTVGITLERRTLAEWEELYRRRRMSERPGRDTDSLLQSLGNIGHVVQCSEAGRCAGDDG